MRKTILSLLLLLVMLGVSAQSEESYHALLKEGKTWNYQEYYHNVWNDEEWTKDVSYVINGTTEIEGKMYYKMYRISEEGTDYYCALHEEDRKVWVYSSDDGDKLIYDFNMSVNDSYMPIDEWTALTLAAINSIQVHDVVLNEFHYVCRREWAPSIVDTSLVPIVEGVGCEEGWELARLFWEYPTNGIIHKENFLSCYEDGVCIFTADDFYNITVMRNVRTSIAEDMNIYDLQGRQLKDKSAKGLYIQNGRKFVTK